MSNAIALDTHAAIKRLINAGFTERQAEAEVSIIADLIEERLATKRDLAELEAHMKSGIEVLKRDLAELEARMKFEIEVLKRDLAEFEARMKSEIEVLKRDLTIRLGGMMAGSVAVMAVLVKLL
ncbi:MAG: hypothetical protein A3G18_08155 [Rhodospirillales bacterium RIFCSPLOWO2_12_FULL_58_28]|nr:MAG: hypothetical protein A3H92_04085 [Rhodospirillales bacterium RIFCSPLOWO2_02_FULL_58_16]OHC77195.1 MAG: hypothetical protein A3G18_08155 [Rhodospirillales bacterium RIFCSPLOWO2_12_FULL_58_28]